MRLVGVVENMSGFACSGCGKVEDIFGGGSSSESGSGGSSSGEETSLVLGAPLLARVPLSRALRVSCDEGRPLVLLSEEERRADAGARASAEALERVAARVREILGV